MLFSLALFELSSVVNIFLLALLVAFLGIFPFMRIVGGGDTVPCRNVTSLPDLDPRLLGVRRADLISVTRRKYVITFM